MVDGPEGSEGIGDAGFPISVGGGKELGVRLPNQVPKSGPNTDVRKYFSSEDVLEKRPKSNDRRDLVLHRRRGHK